MEDIKEDYFKKRKEMNLPEADMSLEIALTKDLQKVNKKIED